jgi:hypothetical protein
VSISSQFILFVLKIHVRVRIFNTTAISLPNKTEHTLRVVVQLVNIFTVLHMIGRSKKNERHMIGQPKKNERLLDVTSYVMSLDVNVSPIK